MIKAEIIDRVASNSDEDKINFLNPLLTNFFNFYNFFKIDPRETVPPEGQTAPTDGGEGLPADRDTDDLPCQQEVAEPAREESGEPHHEERQGNSMVVIFSSKSKMEIARVTILRQSK
jgi:hypothetical protein